MTARDYSTSEQVRLRPDDWLHPLDLSGHFDMTRPLEVDMGCGKGRFLLARAARFPEINFLGVERMLKRVRRVGKKAVSRGLQNIRLLRAEGMYTTRYLLPSNAVRTFYLFFPDPWPKKRHTGNRLFDGPYRDALVRVLAPGGIIHAATDHLPYFESICELLRQDDRFEEIEPFRPAPEEQTDFELMFVEQKPIGRCSFRLV